MIKGSHDKIKKHANRPELKITVSMVVNKLNYQEVECFLEEWKDVGVKGMSLSNTHPDKKVKQ